VFQNVSFSPPPAGSQRGFFSDLHCENLVQFLEIKLTKLRDPLTTASLEFLSLGLIFTSNNSSAAAQDSLP
jgi:hypothetical protein